MPRTRQRGRVWRPLTIAHDTAIRDAGNAVPFAAQHMMITQHPGNLGPCAYIELIDSPYDPRPVDAYGFDCCPGSTTTVFFLLPEFETEPKPGDAFMKMCKLTHIPHGTTQVLDSILTLPEGPTHDQRIVLISFAAFLFAAVSWCPVERNWSHVATYHSIGENVKILLHAPGWNKSTTDYLNSHHSQFHGLHRLYRLATGRTVPQENFLIETLTNDPFGVASWAVEYAGAFGVSPDDNTIFAKTQSPLYETTTLEDLSETGAPPVRTASSVDPTLAISTPPQQRLALQHRASPGTASSHTMAAETPEYQHTPYFNDKGPVEESPLIDGNASATRYPPAGPRSWQQQAYAHSIGRNHPSPRYSNQRGHRGSPYMHRGSPYAQYGNSYANYNTPSTVATNPFPYDTSYHHTPGYHTPDNTANHTAWLANHGQPNQWLPGYGSVSDWVASYEPPSSHTQYGPDTSSYQTQYGPEAITQDTEYGPDASSTTTSPWKDIVGSTDTPGSGATRTDLRQAVMNISEQAKQRNKDLPEYRTVLYDPYRDRNKAALRADAPPYVSAISQAELPTTSPAVQPVTQTRIIEPPPGFGPHPAFVHAPVLAPPGHAVSIQESDDLPPLGVENSSPDSQWRAKRPDAMCIVRPSLPGEYTHQNFKGPFFADELSSPMRHRANTAPRYKSREEEVNHWWWSGNKFSRQEDFYHTVIATNKPVNTVAAKVAVPKISAPLDATPKRPRSKPVDLGRLMIPVLENLAAYLEGPSDKRRDYWSRWNRAPEWCFDHSEEGVNSFFDKDWGNPPARIGRDPRYRDSPRQLRFGSIEPARASNGDWRVFFGRR